MKALGPQHRSNYQTHQESGSMQLDRHNPRWASGYVILGQIQQPGHLICNGQYCLFLSCPFLASLAFSPQVVPVPFFSFLFSFFSFSTWDLCLNLGLFSLSLSLSLSLNFSNCMSVFVHIEPTFRAQLRVSMLQRGDCFPTHDRCLWV
jgi:hypothetical protein